MKALADFFAMGVEWTGIIPATPGTKEATLDAAEALSRRHVRVVLLHIAERYPTRAAQIERGLHLSRQDLSNRLYSVRRVAEAVNILQRAGIIWRERQRGGHKGTQHEERARTHVHPVLIDLARSWDAERAERYKRGKRGSAAFTKKTAALHLVWNGIRPEASNGAGSSGGCVQFSHWSACRNCTHLVDTPPPPPAAPPLSVPELENERRTARPPRRRGGVPMTEKEMIMKDEVKREMRREMELAGADRFFEFMAKNGVPKWICDAQPRKKDGQRGAPLGRHFGFEYPVSNENLLDGFAELHFRLERVGKKRIDLQTKEAPTENGWRVILIDDLPGNQLDAARLFWPGPLAIMETSPENYQALLVAPRELNYQERLQAARFLVARFNGDPGAAAPDQLHRLPGSRNWKASAIADGRPFLTRLIACYDAEEGFDLADQLEEMLSGSAAAPATAPARPRAVRQAAPGSSDNSGEAFRWALRQLARGTSHDVILAGLQTRWLGHHDARDWPARTLHNALHARGARPTRYQAGLGQG